MMKCKTVISQAALFAAIVVGVPVAAFAQANFAKQAIKPTSSVTRGETDAPNRPGSPIVVSAFPLTVLTIAPDGSWGTATETATNRAIAVAIANCKKMYRKDVGCGSQFTAIRAGWSLAVRCGSENIIVAGKRLADTVKAADDREKILRRFYALDMPECTRILIVNPNGDVIRQHSESLRRAFAWEARAPASPTPSTPIRCRG